MDTNIKQIAQNYYHAMANKDLAQMGVYLHPNVHLNSPLASIHGKEAVLSAATGLFNFFETMSIHLTMSQHNQAFLFLELNCQPPINKLKVASLLTIDLNQIIRIELFYDSYPFREKKEEIFR